MRTKHYLTLAVLLLMGCLFCSMNYAKQTNQTVDNKSIPPITYSVDSKAIRNSNGSFKCRMYELNVSNHTDVAQYVTGTFHKKGDSNRISGHFAGTVYPGETKCLHDEIDVEFSVLQLKYERALL